MPRLVLLLALGALLLASARGGHQEPAGTLLTERTWHLGDDSTPEWTEAPVEPEGEGFELAFRARALSGEGTLLLWQRSVGQPWHLELNGVRIGTLERAEGLQERAYVVPPGVLVDGENRLRVVGDSPTDDITIGRFTLYEASLREVFSLRRVVVRVRDPEGGPLPARVTVVDGAGELPRLFYADGLDAAIRRGVAYTSDGEAVFELPEGEYTVHATRGMEWSHDGVPLLVDGQADEVTLRLAREVATPGLVAVDTHVHTLTYSGHGDASVEERLVTLAAEGVELAVATDHNHNTDYRPLQREMGLERWFTPAVGNEVTTPIGHFNVFPLDPDEEIPPYDLHDVETIVAGARERGARAVILNHPRWPDHERGPHGVIGLDPWTGDWGGDWACAMDALELINSETEEEQPMLLFRDWFALLNRGERLAAVGSSDSHTVSGIVGQGRTYVVSATDDPGALHVETCADNVAAGRASLAMGILCELRRDGLPVMGERASGRPDPAGDGSALPAGLVVRVAAPSWVRPRRLTLFANGAVVLERELEVTAGEPTDLVISLDGLGGLPSNDYWLVAVVRGDAVGEPWWPQLNPYTLGATNPLLVDVDGDGDWASAREQAEALLARHGTEAEAVAPLLERVDGAVGAQLLRLVRAERLAALREELRALGTPAAADKPILEGWLEDLR